jgi:hypothetical protein
MVESVVVHGRAWNESEYFYDQQLQVHCWEGTGPAGWLGRVGERKTNTVVYCCIFSGDKRGRFSIKSV